METALTASVVLSSMDPLFIASTLNIIGDILIAVVVFNVHFHIFKERSIDLDVLRTMRREQVYIVIGIMLLVASYLIEIFNAGLV